MRRMVITVAFFGLMSAGVAGLADTPEHVEPPYEQPVVITSVGQSGGALQARILADRVGLDRIYEQRADIELLAESKTLVIVVGASSKGLGAAGVDLEEEMEWAQQLVDHARELGMPIIAMHIEGETRRGGMSDQLIETFVVQADYVVINEAGNEDGLLTELCEEHGIPMQSAPATLELLPIIAALFGIELES